MQILILVLLPISLVTYALCWIIYVRTLHPLSKIPGPFWASVSRVWIVQKLYRGDMEQTQRTLHAKYGPLVRIAPNEIAVADPNAIKSIYPMKNPLTKSDFYPVFGNTAISKHADHFSNTDEKSHSERRRIVNHVYSLSNILQSEEYIDVCSELFNQRLGEFADTGESIDLGEWLQMYAFDVIGELYFGRMFGFMEHRHDHESYIASLDALMPTLCIASVAPKFTRPVIFLSSVLIPSVKIALKALDHIAAAAKSCVTQRFADAEGSFDTVKRRDILQQLMDIRKEKGPKLDFGLSEIELESYSALFAGSDTTAIAMRSVFYYLAKSPAVYREVLAELDKAFAEGQLSIPVKFSEAIKLPFLCACIKEAMRMHPSVQLTMPRLSPKGGMEVCGEYIPAGYRLGMNAAVIHRDPNIFGQDADVYRPSRWLEGNATFMDRYMLQFGAGTRTCIGKNARLTQGVFRVSSTDVAQGTISKRVQDDGDRAERGELRSTARQRSARGIGASTVSLLHSSGAKIIHGDWDAAGGQQLDVALRSSQGVGETTFVETDVTNYESVLNLFQVAWRMYGRVDIAVSNAGIQEIGNLFDPSLCLESVKSKPSNKVIDVNLVGTLYFARIAAVYLKEGAKPDEDKSLVLVSSTAGFKETPGLFAYSAAKHGVLGLLRSLRTYLPKTHNIRVNAICPWMTDTGMVEGIRENWLKEGLPVNSPADLGRVIVEVAIGDDGKSGKWSGRAVFVEGGRGWDIEEGINATEEQWLGKEVSRVLSRGQDLLGDGTDWKKSEAV
ncbi:uncharacterized protein BP5553_01747 [Venustampulla echinocandica]|uniref:Cytochrome P450 n=1 Tax=Venustampulla echinocandica TaxID=2656787 RepID=A0A370U1W5_9HELO|nr:uncharacterized protein BP5553_01747 [Venustampulla echinocandica]RDL41768.1 hypothetical protein BP5553_01747 [Venustampulla echinocandica]